MSRKCKSTLLNMRPLQRREESSMASDIVKGGVSALAEKRGVSIINAENEEGMQRERRSPLAISLLSNAYNPRLELLIIDKRFAVY